MAKGPILQADYRDLALRCDNTKQKMDQINQAIKDLASELVDSNSESRPALVQKHIDLANEWEVLASELVELQRRRDLAYYQQAENRLALAGLQTSTEQPNLSLPA